jgi:hypothetical protein
VLGVDGRDPFHPIAQVFLVSTFRYLDRFSHFA